MKKSGAAAAVGCTAAAVALLGEGRGGCWSQLAEPGAEPTRSPLTDDPSNAAGGGGGRSGGWGSG